MLKENIKNLRKSKGLSQEELAVKLHVVRQTVSKWENGLSVPDAAELISLAEELDTPVGVLLGETVPEHEPDDMSALSGKLGGDQFAVGREKRGQKEGHPVGAHFHMCAHRRRVRRARGDEKPVSALGLQ